MAPLFLNYQEDERTYDEDVNFMLGDSLLVANVVEEGAKTKHVYFPKMKIENENQSEKLNALRCDNKELGFYDFYTGDFYEGGSEVEIPVDFDSIPLFIPSGGILPLAENQLSHLSKDELTDLRIVFAPDCDSNFDFYEDDGCSMDYEKGGYRLTHIQVTSGVQTKIAFRSEGNYKSTVENLLLDVIHREKAPFTVTVAGKELEHFLYKKDFEDAKEGWYYDMSLRSVQIKYSVIEKDYDVIISFEQFDMIGM